jgi:hypothetical protein
MNRRQPYEHHSARFAQLRHDYPFPQSPANILASASPPQAYSAKWREGSNKFSFLEHKD